MVTNTVPLEPPVERREAANGSAMAAFLGAGIGACGMGVVVLLNEAGIFAAPTLYAPAGGVSGRTTLATLIWLVAWAVLHNRWKRREIAPRAVCTLTLILTVLGLLGTFPPLWALL